MKRLQRYYFYVGIPVLLVLIGTFVFWPQIMNTVRGNPHPQVNYLIFLLIVAGCVQMLLHVRRINREGWFLDQFFHALIRDNNPSGAADLLLQDKVKSKFDVAEILTLVLGFNNQTMGALQHAAVKSELERFQTRQNRRLLLSQFMAGMMVGLGLLGTFIGLLGALAEIGKLIGSFTLGAGMTDPVGAISELVARLTSPMQAMGVAFSASLFGVLGSLIMGVLMVSVRNASGDLVSIVQSKVSLSLDAIGADDMNNDLKSLSHALSELAQHSPILQGLVVALDQSERRVREVLNAVSQLVAGMDGSTRASTQVVELFKQSAQTQSLTMRAVEQVQEDFAKMVVIQTDMGYRSEQFANAVSQQQQNIEALLKASETERTSSHQQHMSLITQQQEMLHGQKNALREQLDAQQKYWEEMLKQNQDALAFERKTVREQLSLDHLQWREQMQRHETVMDQLRQHALEQSQQDRNLWKEQMVQRENELAMVMNSLESQAEAKRQAWLSRSQSWNETIAQNLKMMEAFIARFERDGDQKANQWAQLVDAIKADQRNATKTMHDFNQFMTEACHTISQDSHSRTEFTNQFLMQMTEFQNRQEHLLQAIAMALGKLTPTESSSDQNQSEASEQKQITLKQD